MMPADLQEEQEEAWAKLAVRVGSEAGKRVPGLYTFAGYGVED